MLTICTAKHRKMVDFQCFWGPFYQNHLLKCFFLLHNFFYSNPYKVHALFFANIQFHSNTCVFVFCYRVQTTDIADIYYSIAYEKVNQLYIYLFICSVISIICHGLMSYHFGLLFFGIACRLEEIVVHRKE